MADKLSPEFKATMFVFAAFLLLLTLIIGAVVLIFGPSTDNELEFAAPPSTTTEAPLSETVTLDELMRISVETDPSMASWTREEFIIAMDSICGLLDDGVSFYDLTHSDWTEFTGYPESNLGVMLTNAVMYQCPQHTEALDAHIDGGA